LNEEEKQMNGIERNLNPLRWFAALVLAAFVAGCGGGGGGANGGGTGTLGVSLTDAPACGFDAVNVTVRKARVHQSGSASESTGGWSEVTLDPPRKINLLDLTNGVAESLGQTALPAGHYTQVRLVLVANNGSSPTNNSVVLSGAPGTEIALTTPSAVQSGIKLINEFDVAPGQRVDLVLDFDACKSVVRRGNGSYLLKPVIKVIPTVLNGINGFVVRSLLGSNVMVSAQVGGTVVRSTVPDTLTGAFLLARLAPGDYDVVITSDDHATAIIGTVPVTNSSSMVMVSNAAAPISLPPSTTRSISGNVSLNPASATEEVAFVAAKHVSGAEQVTVKSQAAVLDSGDYTMTLPIGAPLFVQYGAGTLTAQDALSGKYTIEASASGYQIQSFNWDPSMVDAIPDFTLTP